MENKDIKVRCSSLDRFFKCSYFLNYPDASLPTSPYANEGTIKHKLAERILKGEHLEVTKDLEFYIDYINDLKQNSDMFEVEYKANLGSLRGTVDCFILKDDTLYVIDLKTGAIEINPYSAQLLGYAYGIKNILKKKNILVKKVYSVIIQNCEEKKIDVTNLLNEFKDKFEKQLNLHNTNQPNAGSHCNWCSALLECSKIRQLINNVRNKKVPDYKDLNDEKIINAYFTNLKKSFIEKYPKQVVYSNVNIKAFIDEDDENIPKKNVTPNEALKKGYPIEKITTSTTKRIKRFDV